MPADQQSGEYWNAASVSPVRGEIKDHYISEQQFKCIYCRKIILTHNKSLWDGEHVISKKLAPRFLFTPLNLAVSCRDCNIAKGEKEVRRNATAKHFPGSSEQYLIIHPHFDVYEDHMRWFGDVCMPKSSKGQATIAVCNLTRFTTDMLGVDGILQDPDFDALVGKLLQAKTPLEALTAIAGLKVHADQIPQS